MLASESNIWIILMEMCINTIFTSYTIYGKCVPSFLLSVEGVGTGWEEAPGCSAITSSSVADYTSSRNWTRQMWGSLFLDLNPSRRVRKLVATFVLQWCSYAWSAQTRTVYRWRNHILLEQRSPSPTGEVGIVCGRVVWGQLMNWDAQDWRNRKHWNIFAS